jgi:geranylgeranyl pyrophosphate synthase
MNVSAKNQTVSEILNRSLNDPVHEFIGRQGKRIRAGLTELSYRICQGTGSLPAEVVESIEWLHAGSLVIDDIQDDSSERRGVATMHRELGMPLAMNAGNFMYFRALEVLADSTLPPAIECQLTREMIRAGRVCHQGQAVDIAACLDQTSPSDWRAIASMITEQKTGTLVALAMTMGAIAASAQGRLVSELRRCGKQIGFALQMRNDLAELLSFAAGTTDRCDDLRNQRVTWPWVWLADQRSDDFCRGFVRRCRHASERDDLSELRSLASEVVSAVESMGQVEVERSIDEPVRLLGEHVLEPELLAGLKHCLTTIRSPSPDQPSSDQPLPEQPSPEQLNVSHPAKVS